MFPRLFISLLLFLSAPGVFAGQVSTEMAKTVAFHFLRNVDSPVTSTDSLALVYTSTSADISLYYVFGHNHGFVIVAADDRIEPILGYSNEGRPFLSPKAGDTVRGNNFWGMMGSNGKQIQYAIDNNVAATNEVNAKWQALLAGLPTRGTAAVVPQLLTTTWDQGWPYNALCPGGAVTGCVATAMGQIMAKHDYPAEGLGSYGYQWGAYPYTGANFGVTNYNFGIMPNSISTMNTPADTAVARLLYQTAVSCRSMWGANTGVGYSTDEDPMTRAFINYFKYAYSTIRYIKKSDYTIAQWDSILQVELLAGRPVYYRGDPFSHAWVLDGVDASNLYHMNWGWGGNYNGYFALTNLVPGGNNVTSNQHAIIGIKPNDGSTLVVNTTWSGTVTKTTNVAVADAITLTVNPGTIIKFAKNCRLQIFGRVLSIGTPSNYITFSASDTTDGNDAIDMDNYYNAMEVMADNDSTKFIYTIIEHSKSSGLYSRAFGKVLVDHCKIRNNHSGFYGAGLSIWLNPITITNSEIYSNHANGQGGGIFIANTGIMSANISQNNIYDNVADLTGGGGVLLATGSTIVLSNNIVYHNDAGVGAGIAILSGNPNIINNKICNNITPSPGFGALYMTNCSANISNNLIANNTANGIVCDNSSPLILNNTITNNNHDFGSGIVFGDNSDANVKNNIIYGNVANNPAYGNQITIWNTNSNPIFDHNNIQNGLSGIPTGGSIGAYTSNIDSGPLFTNPTAGAGSGYSGLAADWSLQLLPVLSPCINAGDTAGVSNILPMLDLGGNPRISGAIDMGAYEYPLPVPTALIVAGNSVSNGQQVCYNATQTITVAGGGNLFKVAAGGSAEMIAGQKISYLEGTMVEEGGHMHGYIAPTGPWCNAPTLPLATTISNEEDGMRTPTVSAGILLFPNPTTGAFTLSLAGHSATGTSKVSIYGLPGEKILETTMETGTSRVFSLAGRASGVYYIRVETGSETIKGKIVKL